MNYKFYFISVCLCILAFANANGTPFRYVGGDVSLLPDYEDANAKYYDQDGKAIDDVLSFCHDKGMNCMRVRLFVNPGNYTGPEQDSNAKQDHDYIIPLCKQIRDHGFALMLDFHYSDTWADPAKQWTPKAWEGLSDSELYKKIYDYTKETLETLRKNGVVPEFIQPGNEISYGMLWGPAGTSNPIKVYAGSNDNWNRFAKLLSNAIQACREECPDAKIIIHTERVAQPSYLKQFYEKLKNYNIDYDIIGLSYYPYFHGSLNVLRTSMIELETSFPAKDIMIVETGYPYAWEVPGTNQKVDYPYTESGQAAFAEDLVDTLLQFKNCTGLFWWWFEYNAKNTDLTGWYNAPLFDSRTGKVTKAFDEICSFGSGPFEAGIENLTISPTILEDQWYDIHGWPVLLPTRPGFYIKNGRIVIVK